MSFNKEKARKKRHFRVRKKVVGTAERPRLAYYQQITCSRYRKTAP